MQHPIPAAFARNVVGVHGAEGETWLQYLPTLIADCACRWSLNVGPPFAPLSFNYAAPATRADGTNVVLKLGVPCRELGTEIAALQHYGGRGIVQLITADYERGALLLERLTPGTLLSELVDDEQATHIAAGVMRELWCSPPAEHAFPSVADWAAGFRKLRPYFGGTTGPLPATLVDEAEQLFADLLASMDTPVLLHGDLQHYNILTAQRSSWLAIDPKGVIGEPAYEIGALLRNPHHLFSLPQPGHIMARRVEQLADELGFDRARIRGWGLAQAVLSAWWSIEDSGHGWEHALACAELLARVRA